MLLARSSLRHKAALCSIRKAEGGALALVPMALHVFRRWHVCTGATVPQARSASTTDTQYTSRRKIEENGWDQKTLLTRV